MLHLRLNISTLPVILGTFPRPACTNLSFWLDLARQAFVLAHLRFCFSSRAKIGEPVVRTKSNAPTSERRSLDVRVHGYVVSLRLKKKSQLMSITAETVSARLDFLEDNEASAFPRRHCRRDFFHISGIKHSDDSVQGHCPAERISSPRQEFRT